MEIYRAGFVGGSVEESTDWIGEQGQKAQRICVPFAGIGRAMLVLGGPDTTIESWDTMHYARCIIDGVFNASQVETNVDKLRYRKGWAFSHQPFKNIDERCAGFIDWVAEEGTLFDKAAIGSAMVRCTLMGRMMQWHANIEQLYSRFQRQVEYNKDWIGQPTKFIHHEGNFFDRELIAQNQDEARDDSYDLVHIDPPKVVNYSDVYSLHFSNFNQALTGGRGPRLPKWSRRNSIPLMRKVMETTSSPRVIFMYVSKVIPTYGDVKKALLQYGEIEDELEFSHNGRTDYGLVIRRTQ